MLLASLLLASMHGMVRFLSADLHPFEIAFFRNVFGFCVLIPWLMRIGRRAFATRRFPLHAVRGVLNGGSMLLWFLGLSLIPLAEATRAFAGEPADRHGRGDPVPGRANARPSLARARSRHRRHAGDP